MKKLGRILFALILICTAVILTSCGKSSNAPEGMKLAYGGDECGYYFYVPEEWTVSNVGDIKSAYISRINTTSVSFVEIDPFAGNPELDDDYFFTQYFEDSLKDFPETMKPQITANGVAATFGKGEENADRAIKYVYTYEYADHKFGFMQILMRHDGRYFLFTYSAQAEEKSEGVTYYDYYLEEKVVPIIENFRFVDQKPAETVAPEYPKDKDGYSLVTDSGLSGFEFYTPDSFKVDYSSAIISVTAADGSNVNMTEATGTGTTFSDYWNARKAELEAIFGTVTEIEVDKQISFANARTAFLYEYTFTYKGEVYHVYQILCIAGSTLQPDGYVFTYTAKETNYAAHKTEVDAMIAKVKFK